jgi:dUTP pyrophosphatase
MEQIYFAKVKETAHIPSKDISNAGYDVYANFTSEFLVIAPPETIMIPTGIASSCSNDYYFQLFERGSTGTKGMGQRCGVIDSSYRGEWFIPITNHNNCETIIIKKETCQKSNDDFTHKYGLCIIYPYEKAVCQVILLPVPKVDIIEISYEKLQQIPSDRGIGALGSTNK